jgi:HlyD family secretion protein
MLKRFANFVLPFLAAGMLAFAVYHLVYAQEVRPQLSPPSQPPQGEFHEGVAGVGVVEPKGEAISVGAPVSGILLEVFHDSSNVGQFVNEGEKLARVDDRELRHQLLVHRANLAAAEASLAKLRAMPRPEELPISEAKVKAAQTAVDLARDRYDRAKGLEERKAMSAEEVSDRRFALESAIHDHRRAQAEDEMLRVGAWAPDVAIAEAQISVMKANIESTQREIERCVVLCPKESTLLQVNVRQGEYVSGGGGQALFVLGDMSQWRLRVDIDERMIPQFQKEAAAYAMMRGDSDLKIPLRFVRLEPMVIPKKSLSGAATERVDTRVMQVIYEIENVPANIRVGQQMDVFVEGAK